MEYNASQNSSVLGNYYQYLNLLRTMDDSINVLPFLGGALEIEKLIKEQKNERIIQQTKDASLVLQKVIEQYGHVLTRADQNTLKFLAAYIEKLHQFANDSEKMRKPSIIFFFSKQSLLDAQNRFILYYQRLPNVIKEAASPLELTQSAIIKSGIIECDGSVVLTLNLTWKECGSDQIQEENSAAVGIILKRLADGELFNYQMSYKKILEKLPSIQQHLQHTEQAKSFQFMRIQFDRSSKSFLFQLYPQQTQVNFKITSAEDPGQNLYLDRGMKIGIGGVILEVVETFITPKQPNKKAADSQQLHPLIPPAKSGVKTMVAQQPSALVLKIIYKDNTEEKVEIYLRTEPLDLKRTLNLPFSLKVHCDEFGHYLTTEERQSAWIRYDREVITSADNLILPLVLENKIELWLKSSLSSLWSDQVQFDL